jgi:hypothetical protein
MRFSSPARRVDAPAADDATTSVAGAAGDRVSLWRREAEEARRPRVKQPA